MKGLIQKLKNQVVFQGKEIYEKGLRFELTFNETADQCDPKQFMDVEVLDFPKVTIVVEPDKHYDWKPAGGSVGYLDDGLGVEDSDLVAGWVLKHFGYPIPIVEAYIDDDSEMYGMYESGIQEDGSYFIPSSDSSSGYLLQWNHDKKIERLWECFEDVLMVEGEDRHSDLMLHEDWHIWPAGTEREAIWHWFDQHHSKGVAYLLYEYEFSGQPS